MNADIQQMLEKFISYLNGKTVLDIGCAAGRESKYLAEKGCKVTGIDITDEFLGLARLNCPECDFKKMDMMDLKFAEATYDGIWACASFLHIPKENAWNTLIGFREVLKDQGVLYISVMEGDFNAERRNETLNWNYRHFSDYTEKEVCDLVVSAKFKIIDLIKKEIPSGKTFLHVFAIKS